MVEVGDEWIYGEKKVDGQQSVKMREVLLATGTRELVEASSADSIWGIGFDADVEAAGHSDDDRMRWGTNLLGQALMEVRRRIRVEEGLEETVEVAQTG